MPGYSSDIWRDKILAHCSQGARGALAYLTGEVEPSPILPLGDPEEMSAYLSRPTTTYDDLQFQAYVFDTVISNAEGDAPVTIPTRNRIAKDLGYDTYFDAHASIRGLDPDALLDRAACLLGTTNDEYKRRFQKWHGAIPISEDAFQSKYTSTLTERAEFFSTDHIYQRVEKALDELVEVAGAQAIRLHRGSATGISANISVVDPRSSCVILAEAGGLESLRAAYHALGHALYGVTANPQDLLGVNIAGTEVVAFYAQQLALASAEEVTDRQREYLALFPYYFARMYCIRTQCEALAYRGLHDPEGYFQRLSRQALLVDPSHAFTPGRRVSAGDFVMAFDTYMSLPAASSWSDVVTSAFPNRQVCSGALSIRLDLG